MKLLKYIFLILFPFSLLAQSISGLSGSVEHDSSVIISGSSFGSKGTPAAAPVKYDDFESGTDGNDLSGWSFSKSGGINPHYEDDDFLRDSSSMSAECEFPGSVYLSSFGLSTGSTRFHKVYIDFYYLYDPASPPSRNHKLFRFYADGNQGMPDRYLQVFCSMEQGFIIETDGGGTSKWTNDWTIGDAVDTWNHFQFYFEANTDNNTDGITQCWIEENLERDETDWKHYNSATQDMWNGIWFGNYLGHDAAGGCDASPGQSNTFWDNVYIDSTRARVEIGNEYDYESCNHREIQIPSAWSGTSITVTMNTGSFATNDSIYFFAVDQDGNISDGFGTKIGESNGT